MNPVLLPPVSRALWRHCGFTGVLCIAVVAGLWWEGHVLQAVFPWLDLAVVFALAAVPFAAGLSAVMHRRRAASLIVLAVGLGLGAFSLDLMPLSPSTAVPDARRIGAGLVLAMGAAIASLLLRPSRRLDLTAGGSHAWLIRWFALSILLTLFVPAAYAQSRSRRLVEALEGSLSLSRLGYAQRLASQLLVLEPGARVNGQPLRDLSDRLAEQLQALEARLARLPENGPVQTRLEQARVLAILERDAPAIRLLIPLADHPEAAGLLGSLHETHEDWDTALTWHRRAASAWHAAPASAARSDGLASSVRGIAYCQRKLGRYAEARDAYQELLELSPTAATHFLLAKFYEDTQQSAQARTHALKAISLEPDRYRTAGTRLLDNLQTYQFGCLAIFAQSRVESD